MSQTRQRLSVRTIIPIVITSDDTLNIQTGLQFKDGEPAKPNIVQPLSNCPFLNIIAKNDNGSFDIHNPTQEEVSFSYIAHHIHSVEYEPIPIVAPVVTPSLLPSPPICAVLNQNPLAVHSRYTLQIDEDIPDISLNPAYRMPLDEISAALDDLANPYISWDPVNVGRFIINRSGRYQIIGRANAWNDAEEIAGVVYTSLMSSPDLGPNIVLPLIESDLIELNVEDNHQFVIEAIIEVDEADPIEDRTFEMQMWADKDGFLTGDYYGSIGGSLQITRLSE